MGMGCDTSVETAHLWFEVLGDTGKTLIIGVYNKHTEESIGKISWCGRWRKYWYEPHSGTGYDAKCLKDISDVLERLMNDRKQKKDIK